jgi:hypothetical protein
VFNHLQKIIPILRFRGDLLTSEITRDSHLRVYASSQHPIALAGALMMLLPLGVYLGLTTRRTVWWVATFLIGMGALATLSRTGITMLIAAGIVLWRLRPADTRRLVPLLLPAFVVVFLALPQALGSFKSTFFPKGGIVAEQSGIVPGNQAYANGRLADIGPAFRTVTKHDLILGLGFGTRFIDPTNEARSNTLLLDDEWLGLLLDGGILAVGAFLWVFVRTSRRLGRIARSDDSPDGLLAAALAASIIAYGVGMITLDAFSFTQVTFLFVYLLAMAASLLSIRAASPRIRAASPASFTYPAG